MATIMFGDFTVQLKHNTRTEKRKRVVATTKLIEEVRMETVHVQIMESITVGCSEKCAGLCAYTKSSLRRAIKEGDLSASGRCNYCGLMALVGEGRERVISVPKTVEQLKEVAVTREIPHVYEEEYEVEVPYTTTELVQTLEAPVPNNKACGSTVQAPVASNIVTKEMMASAEPSKGMSFRAYSHIGKRMLSDYEDMMKKFDLDLQRNSELQRRLFINKFSPVTQRKGGAVGIRHLSMEQAKRKRDAARLREQEEKDFLAGKYEQTAYVGEIQQDVSPVRGESVGHRTQFYRRAVKAPKHTPRTRKDPSVDFIIKEICKIARKFGKPIEYIGKGRNSTLTAHFVNRLGGKAVKVSLAHERGHYINQELHFGKCGEILQHLSKFSTVTDRDCRNLQPGDSGLLLDERHTITKENTKLPYFVLRGRMGTKLVNALEFTTSISSIHHYSGTPELQFFKGWKKVFDEMSPQTNPHNCSIDFTNEQCGELTALLSQSLYPVRKLSCIQCRNNISNLSWEEYKEYLATHMDCCGPVWDRFGNNFGLALSRKLIKQVSSTNTALDVSLEITRLTQNYTTTPMLQIQDINRALMKGASVNQEELEKASRQLLAMTQWWKNHMTLTDEDALKIFRNKRSSKALLNPSLICDNQLDKNGNFIWGERGRHSKRFFANFFEEVIPSEGYGKYTIRKGPNGQRELAIGALVVPQDLEKARLALQGNSVKREPLTLACVSKQDGNFVYPCCCVTHDDGKPLHSELKSPTKRHLVVGTSGDPKYIDLPATETDRMYIAKEGYCYLNIFLAMLVNVNEEDAKDFTKMVRDVIVPKLGKWPSMMDVATAAYMLTVFHPETRCAELPRILVDHASQTMHVIDSFGSLTVGYHILKAGTVNQLIQFASNDLQGEMKFYRVGGDINNRMNCEFALITSVFKPKRMIKLLEEDPYILLMGLVSPSLLMHTYRMRHLERGIEMWIHKNQSVAKIFILLEQITQKVALNDVLLDQLSVIADSTSQLMEVFQDCPRTYHSYVPARDILTIYLERKEANAQLKNNGFVELNERLYSQLEKMYIDRLKKEWSDLGWLERSCATRRLKKFAPCTEENLRKIVSGDTIGSLNSFVSDCFMKARTHLRERREFLYNKCESFWRSIVRRIVNCLLSIVHKCYSDIFYLVNVCLVFSLLIQMSSVVSNIVSTMKIEKQMIQKIKTAEEQNTINTMYSMMCKTTEELPSADEFLDHIERVRPDLLPMAKLMAREEEEVSTQSKSATQVNFEKIIAFMALLTMCVDAERSDALFRILHKLKTVFGTMGEDVRIQSLDEIQNLEDDKKLTVDFDLNTSMEPTAVSFDVKFDDWWHRQLQQNRTVPHYRTSGEFLEFTRETSAKVANHISTSSNTEFLVRGAVGSGESTGLPHQLSKKGKVLLLEPTRPLAENVSKQSGQDPFYHAVTLRMRGLSKFGSSNITVMTSGFAFHYYANNPSQLADFDFVIIDECHVLDSSTIAFNCALKEYSFAGKLIKVSATPPGREREFTTQHPVKLKIEDHLSFQNFVQAQGTGANADMIQHGNNILVYVSSYNEVDQLTRLLTEKQYKVTKVDGRTMQMGNTEITTTGVEGKPHFVVATNIIENGVTLDVDCVVDFGLKVVAVLDTDNRCVRYNKKAVTYGERIQRLGRVGRFKAGVALRIGHTEKGIEEIPEFIATEAAFLSFAYGLPVTTQGVSTNLLSKCTVKQARSALNFELTPFFTINFVKYDGSIHPEVHKILKGFKLRESEMLLSKLAIPHQYTSQWLTAREYERLGIHMNCDENTRIPFFVNGIPDKVFEMLWNTICKYRSDAGFGRISSVNATKISYTLSTDPTAIPRTLAILDHLLSEEMMKKSHFDTIGSAVTGHSFTLSGITEGIRKRYLKDHTQHNISILQQAKAQLLEFDSRKVDLDNLHTFEELGVLNTVRLQSHSEVANFLQLKGKWDGKKFMNDALLAVFTLIGGGWMVWEYFTKSAKESVSTQGKKRMIQKLKFRDARDRKVGREVYTDEYTMEHTFGEAYTKRGKQKGSTKTKGMGRKTRNFIHMYGVEPENYSTIRFLDPLTGHTMDENPRVDIRLVQEEFGDIRREMINEGDLDTELVNNKPGIEAYLFGKNTEEALKVDLTPHNPLAVCRSSATIAGFPEREGELRQTGKPTKIPLNQVPPQKEHVAIESRSVYKGLRDYSSISTLVCQLVNASDGHSETIFGVGYGSYVITNGHLFKRNNGTLTIKTWHGDFVINNSTQIKIHFIEGKDAIIIRMPKDFPPFAKRSFFRAPKREERASLVGTNFQDKSLRSTVSESSIIVPEGTSSFWTHWITTQNGYCGLPLVSTTDGFIVGIHGLTSNDSDKNFFVPFTDNFEKDYLLRADELTWNKHWLWQPDRIAWGTLNLVDEQPRDEFKISKLITDLFDTTVTTQSKRSRWVLEAAEGNLKACGQADSTLVTKHVVKRKCPYFEQYLSSNNEAAAFFRPLMGAYQPSRLNQDAFKKDFFKYNKPVVLNEVDFAAFEDAVWGVKMLMNEFNFHECTFVTDTEEIFDSLNMKAAVGAQYRGKKSDFFHGMDEFDKDRLLYQSCERLFYGQKGLWNGSLKAELRPIEKVEANKTRTFTAAPIDTLLGAKVCVDDFNNQFYSLHLQCPWTVGMTKFYGGWDKLMRSLPDGWLYCHADGSQFDSSLTPLLLNAVLDIRTFFMEDWWIGQEMLSNLYAEIVYTPILAPDGTIFKKFRGNNSGQPSTVVDNTLMVVIAVYYSCHKQGWSDDEIQERLVFFANGDDIILAVRDEDSWLYDKLGGSFAELGLNYNFDERTKKREELWFMSHRAIEVDGLYIPKLEQERIVSILEWDRSKELMHRTEAISASMIEAWGYPELLREIRKFYLWILQKDEFKELAAIGKVPYIAETALRKLYTDQNAQASELQRYLDVIDFNYQDGCNESVSLQSGKVEKIDAGAGDKGKGEDSGKAKDTETKKIVTAQEKDVGTSTRGRVVPRLQKITGRMNLPTVSGKVILNLDHLLDYKPRQTDLFNTRSTKQQFDSWYNAIRDEFELEEDQANVVMNGFMVWCIENGTSPDINGMWVMMDGDEQVEYPLRPMVENAKPTLRQIMHHFSDAAEAYIEMRNMEGLYMPRYGLLRNLRDRSLARYAFDFYEITSKTPVRAKEAVMQMKAAALTGTVNKLFGLDGNVGTTSEDTERHTARDVNQNMHTLLGVGSVQ
uniref:Genome polyprotein n=1 Tax=Passionfruit Vietnam virus TaxID=2490442 RepID=A0A7T0BS06_9POTV|nr:polyprotein [Passionfruit Vietnam virus]